MVKKEDRAKFITKGIQLLILLLKKMIIRSRDIQPKVVL